MRMRWARILIGIVVLLLVLLGISGNSIIVLWHYLVHGDDRIVFEQRNFINPQYVGSINSIHLIPTANSFFGREIYVASPSDLKHLPGAVYIERNGAIWSYELSGGY